MRDRPSRARRCRRVRPAIPPLALYCSITCDNASRERTMNPIGYWSLLTASLMRYDQGWSLNWPACIGEFHWQSKMTAILSHETRTQPWRVSKPKCHQCLRFMLNVYICLEFKVTLMFYVFHQDDVQLLVNFPLMSRKKFVFSSRWLTVRVVVGHARVFCAFPKCTSLHLNDCCPSYSSNILRDMRGKVDKQLYIVLMKDMKHQCDFSLRANVNI